MTNKETISTKPRTAMKPKIIKRYQNRKLYDTQQSCYVTLADIAKMIKNNEELVVIDNKTQNNITAPTLLQIIFEMEKKTSQYAPLYVLREVIKTGRGSISSYLHKLGVFSTYYTEEQPSFAQGNTSYKRVPKQNSSVTSSKSVDLEEEPAQSIEQRVANAVTSSLESENSDSNLFTKLPKSEKNIDS